MRKTRFHLFLTLAAVAILSLTGPAQAYPTCEGIRLQDREHCTWPPGTAYIQACTHYYLEWSKIQAGYRIVGAGKTNTSFTVDVQNIEETGGKICSVTTEKKFNIEGWRINSISIQYDSPDRSKGGKKVIVRYGGPNPNPVGANPLPIGPGPVQPD